MTISIIIFYSSLAIALLLVLAPQRNINASDTASEGLPWFAINIGKIERTLQQWISKNIRPHVVKFGLLSLKILQSRLQYFRRWLRNVITRLSDIDAKHTRNRLASR